MTRVPVIHSHCPLRWASAPEPGRDFCGQCQRQVHNLDAMSQAERQRFFSTCGGEVCVSFTVRKPVRAALAIGATLAAAAAFGAAAADAPAADYEDESQLFEVVITGGTVSTDKLQWVDEAEAATPDKSDLPEITSVSWLPTPET